MKKNYLKDIAQLVGKMDDRFSKNYLVERWWTVKQLAETSNEKEIKKLIEAICEEDLAAISRIIK